MVDFRYLRLFSLRVFGISHVWFPSGIQMSSATQVEPANQYFSVDPEGEQIVDLNFVSEALGMPAAKGYGWAQFKFGDQIGQNSRYTISRKLGRGMYSSTWLARDNVSVYRQPPYY